MLSMCLLISSVWFAMTSQTLSEKTKPTSVLSTDANWIYISVKPLSFYDVPVLKRGHKYLWDVRGRDF